MLQKVSWDMLARVLDCAGEPKNDLDAEEICLVMAASLRREVIDTQLIKYQMQN